ncbi:MAG TPA: HAD hydrolase-like protein [Vitreimonas sp.]|nr:HAD hydrolase-like protein [Vitreimonas sp.]
MSTFSTVLFDWDGCLVDSLPLWLKACKECLPALARPLSDYEIARHIIPELKMLTQYGVSEDEVEKFGKAVIESIYNIISEGKFHAGALELIDTLQIQNKNFAVVTSSNRYFVNLILDKHHASNCFPYLVAREDVINRKPHPEPLFKALDLLSAHPNGR